ncbi:Crp/Fnr family transcriptional regulator [Tepidibacter aestuarii]|uniref:Crp/Fnr family transcriptional regulator n=1 Tax=Tepidibacter aestuarii TaxID=2925782 RepID=UPI0020BD932C|nr:Crp/Fnr family transcriptional regulator [Tepidibacter aestuarii]CAH2214689.1 CRP/FNR family transcriptional regulator, anaerobic regulatory protein [Tepidibacter aestuarii]
MNSCCERCKNKLCASKIYIFENLSNEELVEIIKMTGHENYNKKETIFVEGENANKLYLINEGKIKLFKYTKDGKEQILHILSDGDFFGELNLFNKGEYNFNAQTISPTKLCTLTKEKMRNIILERPEIGLKILEVIGSRLSNLESLAQNLATNDVEVRIAYMLLELKDKYGKEISEGIEINLPITRENMSNYTGVARETISRKLKKFEEENIIKLVGIKKIIIINQEKLEDYL